MKITIDISNEDYKTLKLLSTPYQAPTVEEQIKEAIKVYLVNWVQYIPYIQKHNKWCISKDQAFDIE